MKLKLSSKKYRPKTDTIKVPEGFTIIIDTREQKPLFQDEKYDSINKIYSKLDDGDYSIKGFEEVFSIERKQASDFFSYIGRERQKTQRKLRRLSEMEYALLCLEGLNLDDLEYQQTYTKLHPAHAFGFIKSIEVKYGVHFLAHRSRGFIEKWVLDRMMYFYEIKEGLR